jgi:hypothetical protein
MQQYHPRPIRQDDLRHGKIRKPYDGVTQFPINENKGVPVKQFNEETHTRIWDAQRKIFVERLKIKN